MYKIGLTGGIGAGKSTVARIFEILGVPVYNADAEAKKLMEEDPELTAGISLHFGNNIYANGKLNRALLAEKVFNNKEKLDLLNQLVHPATMRHSKAWMKEQHGPYAIKEAALLFESGSHADLDRIIGVFAPVSLRIHRSMKRDQASREKVMERMHHQLDDAIKMKLCDDMLFNDEQQLLIPQVIMLHEKLIRLAAASKSDE